MSRNTTLLTVARIIAVFTVFMLLSAFQRMLFTAVYATEINAGLVGSIRAMLAGMPMDASIAAYLTAIPSLLATVSIWTGENRTILLILRIYFIAVASLLAIIFTADLILYSYWGFRLDMTPVFYLTTSPSAAMASASWWQLLLMPVAVGAIATIIYLLLQRTVSLTQLPAPTGNRIVATAVSAAMLGLLFIAIRGGLTVSTMNPSRAYFSNNARLNHAAMNPVFSLLYSASHRDDFAGSFRIFDDETARQIFSSMNAPKASANADSIPPIRLTPARPDIYLVILESFSSHIMPSLGGEPIAVRLDSIAAEGVVWTRFIACSFRTDRAIPAIINAFPSQPTTSLMKYADKMEKLPSIASELKRQGGYATTYYYGGDANFTNMLACLVSGGFETIVSDKDFKLSERLSKWGAHDDVVFNRVISDAAARQQCNKPQLRVIQTSSSHEPFDVPYYNPRFADNPRANSLAFTDSCLADFVKRLDATPRGRNALIVIVPDHYGTWPAPGTLDNPVDRHAIPLVMTGGALNGRGIRLDTPGCQTDIAATLLAMLGMDHSMFPFSRNLLDSGIRHYGWFSEPELAALIDDRDNIAVYNTAAGRAELTAGPNPDSLMTQTKAYLQTVYTTIANLK